MHPILESRQRIAVYLLAWLPVAAVMTVILRRGTPATSLFWSEAVIVAVPMCLVYAFMCLSAWYVCRVAPLRDHALIQLIVTLAAASLLSSGLWFALGQTWVLVTEPWAGQPGLSDRYAAQFVPLFLNGTLLYLLAAAVHYLLIAFAETRQVEKRALEMQILARDAELKALRAQIDPHFLFNSLNSISALSVSDPPGARRMCLLLADFLRTSLVLGTRPQISVTEELKLVDNFLDIEKVRYGPRLSVTRSIDSECNECMVPPLLIQPLVENAVRHGIAKLVEGGTLRIGVQRRDTEVEILLENPVDTDHHTKGVAGVGLQNVRARLANMFSDDARVEISQGNGQFSVRLRFPCILFGERT